MRKTIGTIGAGIIFIVTVSTVLSSSERSEREYEEGYEETHDSELHEDGVFRSAWLKLRADVPPVDNATYQSECGSCHFAYQAGLLPQQDWERVMNSLAEHYGDDASLDDVTAAEIRNYLLDNAAEHAGLSRARAFSAGSNAGKALPRITRTRYFRHEHAEIPLKAVQGSAQVGSFGNCQACHPNADAGIYNEHQVVIPGFGKWND